MKNKIIDYLILIDPKYQLGVLLFFLATTVGLYKRFWISYYARNLKKMGLMDNDSKLKVKGLFLKTLTNKFSLIIKNPPPTDNINVDKVSSFTQKGYEVIDSPKNVGLLRLNLRKDTKLKPYTLFLNNCKKGFIPIARVRGTKTIVQTREGHGYCIGKTGMGKSIFQKGISKILVHKGYRVLFCSTINDSINVDGVENVQLSNEDRLDWILEELEGLVSKIEEDPKLEVKTYLILDEFSDFISTSKPKEAIKQKKFINLVRRILRLGRKNSLYILASGQESAAQVLQSVQISRGAFQFYVAFKTDSLKAFSNLFGDELPAHSLTQAGVAYFKDDSGQACHIHCPLEVK